MKLKRNVFAYPIAFLISQNGDKSVYLLAKEFDECNVSVHVYQLLKEI
jgi:hypothetical protein